MSNTSPRPGQGRKRSAIWLIVGALGVFALLLVMLAVTVMLRPAPPLTVPGANVVTLDDGTELSALITYGTDHEWVGEIPSMSVIERLFDPVRGIRETAGTGGSPAYVIWLSGVKPTTGEPNDMSWWAYSTVVDQYGEEIRDNDAHRTVMHFTANGSSTGGASGDRPLEPVNEEATVVVVRSTLTPFYTNGKAATLRLHDSTGKVMAKVPFPVLHAVPPSTWKPDPFPTTKTMGNTGVTLTGVEYARGKIQDDGIEQPTWQVNPRFEFAWKNKPTNEFSFGTEVFDSLGNRNSGHRIFLSPHTEAWKLRVNVWRNKDSEFEAFEQWEGPELTLPAADGHRLLSETGVANGANIAIQAIGGRGTVSYKLNSSREGSGSSSSSGSIGNAHGNRMALKTKIQHQDGKATVTVESQAAHLALRIVKRPDQRLILKVVDDQGRMVSINPIERHDLTLLIMAVPADAKSIKPTIIVYEGATVDFLIAPPVEKQPTAEP